MHSSQREPGHLDFSLDTHQALQFVGTGISDFQVDPAHPESDWGQEVLRKQRGQKTGIVGSVSSGDLPRFNNQYRQILPRATELNNNAFRTSLDFARLCPELGVFDEQLMAHYIRILARCHFLNLEPIVTLHHWTMPRTFAKYDQTGRMRKGSLEHREIVDHFAFYVDQVTDFLCSADKIRAAVAAEGYAADFLARICDERLLCRWFISLNEPVNLLFTPYVVGEFPPYQIGRIGKIPKLREKLRQMHEISYTKLHDRAIATQSPKEQKEMKVGMAHNVTIPTRIPFYEDLANWGLVERMQEGMPDDFMGLQYYFRIRLGLNGIKGPDPRYQSDHDQFGQVYPAGVYDILHFACQHCPEKELILSEFGFADNEDRKRPDWILDTVQHLIRAKREGVRVRGALLWSLIQNLEWCKGMDVNFGLYDRNGERLPTDSESSGHISSREVWAESSHHLRNPTPETAKTLQDLKVRTRQQLQHVAR